MPAMYMIACQMKGRHELAKKDAKSRVQTETEPDMESEAKPQEKRKHRNRRNGKERALTKSGYTPGPTSHSADGACVSAAVCACGFVSGPEPEPVAQPAAAAVAVVDVVGVCDDAVLGSASDIACSAAFLSHLSR